MSTFVPVVTQSETPTMHKVVEYTSCSKTRPLRVLTITHYKHVAIGIATKTQVNSQPEPACGFIIAYADIL